LYFDSSSESALKQVTKYQQGLTVLAASLWYILFKFPSYLGNKCRADISIIIMFRWSNIYPQEEHLSFIFVSSIVSSASAHIPQKKQSVSIIKTNYIYVNCYQISVCNFCSISKDHDRLTRLNIIYYILQIYFSRSPLFLTDRGTDILTDGQIAGQT